MPGITQRGGGGVEPGSGPYGIVPFVTAAAPSGHTSRVGPVPLSGCGSFSMSRAESGLEGPSGPRGHSPSLLRDTSRSRDQDYWGAPCPDSPAPSLTRSTTICGASSVPCTRTTAFSTSLNVPGTAATGSPQPGASGPLAGERLGCWPGVLGNSLVMSLMDERVGSGPSVLPAPTSSQPSQARAGNDSQVTTCDHTCRPLGPPPRPGLLSDSGNSRGRGPSHTHPQAAEDEGCSLDRYGWGQGELRPLVHSLPPPPSWPHLPPWQLPYIGPPGAAGTSPLCTSGAGRVPQARPHLTAHPPGRWPDVSSCFPVAGSAQGRRGQEGPAQGPR